MIITKKLNGLPWFEMEIPDKVVVCARCFSNYNLKDAPKGSRPASD